MKRDDNLPLNTMWKFLEMGEMQSDYPQLKEYVLRLRQMLMQNTAGQRKDKPKDIDFDEFEMLKNFIVIEAMALVLSGDYE